ncbi:MAG TPA: TlpA disulfide reductase family protein [Phycisphaerae bacterium]|nr:TlpA disulfide reductase family protein [Phycisphaerae bacterium]
MTRRQSNLVLGLAFILALFGVTAAILAVRFLTPPQVDTLIASSDRQTAAISMPTLAGSTFSSTACKGHVLLVNYFATWCPPCVAEMPDLVKIAADYQPKGLVVAGVSVDAPNGDREKLLRGFVADHALTYPILLPGPGSPVYDTDMTIPQTFLIDKQGRTAYHLTGELDAHELRPLIDRLIAEP